MRNKFEQLNRIPLVFMVQVACLTILGIAEFLNMTNGGFPGVNVPLLMNGGIVLALMGLWGITVWKTPGALLRRNVIMGVLMFLWFLALEMNRRINHTPLQSFTLVAAVYLIALPFAAMTQDQDRQIGIRIVSGIYAATALLLLTYGLILLAGGKLPGVLAGRVYWDGPRLFVLHHPNLTSRMFMIGLAVCMGFAGQVKAVWARVLLYLVSILLFVGIALSNCRAVIIVSCVILAGNVFFLFYNSKQKRIFIGAVVAVLVAALLFLSSNWIYQWNRTRLINLAAQRAEQEQTLVVETDTSDNEDALSEEVLAETAPEWRLAGNGNSSQGTLLDGIPTMNGRTRIWAAYFEKIRNDPAILLRGVTDTRLVLGNMHTHNAWMEALIMLGLPGFLLVLLFCWNAAWASLRLLWHAGTGLFRKNIALLTLATMVAALLEPCLFITYLEWSFSDFFFFLGLGYLTLWDKQIRCK